MKDAQLYDVVVIGAGFAGLIAARDLRAGGASVCLLEARDRVGGRTQTETIGGGIFDVGGQWIGPGQTRMLDLCETYGVETFPTYCAGRKILDLGGRVRTYTGTIPRMGLWDLLVTQLGLTQIEGILRGVDAEVPGATPDAARLDGQTLASFAARRMPSKNARAVLAAAVQVIFGLEPEQLNLLQFLTYLKAGGGLEPLIEIEGGAQERRFVEGVGSLTGALAAELGGALRLGCPVTHVQTGSEGVRVRGPWGEVTARRAVVAVPPYLYARWGWSPALPVLRDQLGQVMPMGSTVKVLCTFERPFWRQAGFSGEAVSDVGPMAVTFDNTTHDGAHPALLGFVVGEGARQWQERHPEERKGLILEAFARYFGDEARAPLAYHEKNWGEEIYTRGCPVAAFAPGTLLATHGILRAPMGPVHWAGTETASVWTGFMEGAVRSGERAGAEVLARLGR